MVRRSELFGSMNLQICCAATHSQPVRIASIFAVVSFGTAKKNNMMLKKNNMMLRTPATKNGIRRARSRGPKASVGTPMIAIGCSRSCDQSHENHRLHPQCRHIRQARRPIRRKRENGCRTGAELVRDGRGFYFWEMRPRMAALAMLKLIDARMRMASRPLPSVPHSQPSVMGLRRPSST